MVTKTLASMRLLQIARANNNTIIWDDFKHATENFDVYAQAAILIVCGRRGIKLVEEYAAINIVGNAKTFFECTEALSDTARSRGGKLSWQDFNEIIDKYDLNDAATIDKLSTFCQRAGIKLTNEQLAPVEEKPVEPAHELDDNDALIGNILKFWERNYNENRPLTKPNRRPLTKPNRRPSMKPNRRPLTKPNRRPSMKPNRRPSMKPNRRPSMKPNRRPLTKPNRRPSMKPNRRPSSKRICGSSATFRRTITYLRKKFLTRHACPKSSSACLTCTNETAASSPSATCIKSLKVSA